MCENIGSILRADDLLVDKHHITIRESILGHLFILGNQWLTFIGFRFGDFRLVDGLVQLLGDSPWDFGDGFLNHVFVLCDGLLDHVFLLSDCLLEDVFVWDATNLQFLWVLDYHIVNENLVEGHKVEIFV